MWQTVSGFTFLLALLTSQGTSRALSVQAISTSAPHQRDHALSSHESTSLSRAAPVPEHNAIAFISTRPAQREGIGALLRRRYQQLRGGVRKGNQQEAARGDVPNTPETASRFDPRHPLYTQYVMERRRQRAARLQQQKELAAGKEEEEDEEYDAAIYKNTIRSCLSSDKFDRLEFCQKTGFAPVCEALLDRFERTNRFKDLDFNALVYKVSAKGETLDVSLPLLETPILGFLIQLYYSLTRTCNYDVAAEGLVQVFFEDGIDETVRGQASWSVTSAEGGGLLGLAARSLRKVLPMNALHYYKLHQVAVGVTTLIVKAAGLRYTSPVLTRALSFVCRWKRPCRFVIKQFVKHTFGTFPSSRTGASAQPRAALVEKLKAVLDKLLGDRLKRLAGGAAIEISGWLTQATAAIFESELDTGENSAKS